MTDNKEIPQEVRDAIEAEVKRLIDPIYGDEDRKMKQAHIDEATSWAEYGYLLSQQALEEKDNWIPASERLPRRDGETSIYSESCYLTDSVNVFTGYFNFLENKWFRYSNVYEVEVVTHFQPINVPSPPKPNTHDQ